MWVQGDDVGLGDLEWRGAAYAAEVSGNKPEAEVADRDWFANAQLPSREPFAAVSFDPEALDSGQPPYQPAETTKQALLDCSSVRMKSR